jgi:hypothetical protein
VKCSITKAGELGDTRSVICVWSATNSTTMAKAKTATPIVGENLNKLEIFDRWGWGSFVQRSTNKSDMMCGG